MSNPYPSEFRERALRMLAEARPDHASDFAAANHVAGRLGVNPETLRLWKKRGDIDAGQGPRDDVGGAAGDQTVEETDRRVGESERDPAVCERVFRHRARPHLVEMIAFINVMKDRFAGRARLPHDASS